MGIREIILLVLGQQAMQAVGSFARAAEPLAQTKLQAAAYHAVGQFACAMAQAAGIGLVAAGPEFAAWQSYLNAVISAETTAAQSLQALPPLGCQAAPAPAAAPATGGGAPGPEAANPAGPGGHDILLGGGAKTPPPAKK